MSQSRNQEEQQREIYDSRKDEYSKITAESYPSSSGYPSLMLTYREHLRWVKKLKVQPGEKVLDVGCNIGMFLTLISQQAGALGGEIQGFGIDISEQALKCAKKHCPPHFHFEHGSIENHLPFEDNQFDVVTCMDVIEHLAHPQNALKEIQRVLKPSGRFLFHIPVADLKWSMDWVQMKLNTEKYDAAMATAGHNLDVMLTKDQLEESIRSAGLNIIKSDRYNIMSQNIFDYHVRHRVLNTLFFKWKWPIDIYHHGIGPLIEGATSLIDFPLKKLGVGASTYFFGLK